MSCARDVKRAGNQMEFRVGGLVTRMNDVSSTLTKLNECLTVMDDAMYIVNETTIQETCQASRCLCDEALEFATKLQGILRQLHVKSVLLKQLAPRCVGRVVKRPRDDDDEDDACLESEEKRLKELLDDV